MIKIYSTICWIAFKFCQKDISFIGHRYEKFSSSFFYRWRGIIFHQLFHFLAGSKYGVFRQAVLILLK